MSRPPKAAPVVLLLRPTEAAIAMGVSKTTAYELIARGEIPSVRIGKAVRVPVEALREWVRRKTAERTEASV